MEKELYIKQLKPYLYLMDEAHEATGYIVVGEEKVCVIDTMNGYNDLHKVVRDITDKPIVVVNTHGHPDHIFGNVYFDDISLMHCMRNGAVEISEGKTENDLPYKWFGGVDKQHPFKLDEGKQYQQMESVICYR
jgi:glyoxylase-like metal-dependent hydrolase (beta-lactamase superfamily II)